MALLPREIFKILILHHTALNHFPVISGPQNFKPFWQDKNFCFVKEMHAKSENQSETGRITGQPDDQIFLEEFPNTKREVSPSYQSRLVKTSTQNDQILKQSC